MNIVRGTTPTIIITFSQIDVSDLTDGYLVIKQELQNVIEKPLTDATIDDNAVTFTLAQEETLSLSSGVQGKLMFDWLVGATRGRSQVEKVCVSDSGIDEVIE